MAQKGSRLRIGEVESGQPISLDYIGEHPFLGFTDAQVKSFTLSFMQNGQSRDYFSKSDNLKEFLPHLKTLPFGSKIYFDRVILVHADGSTSITSGHFILSDFVMTPMDRIYIGGYLNGSVIDKNALNENSLLVHQNPLFQIVYYIAAGTTPDCLWEHHRKGNRVPPETLKMIRSAKPGTKVFFEKIELLNTQTGDTIRKNAFLLVK